MRVGQVGCIWFRDFQFKVKFRQFFYNKTNVPDFSKARWWLKHHIYFADYDFPH